MIELDIDDVAILTDKRLGIFEEDGNQRRNRLVRGGPLSRRAQLGLLVTAGSLAVALLSLVIYVAQRHHHCSTRQALLPEDIQSQTTAGPPDPELPWKSNLLPQDFLPLTYFLNLNTDLTCMEFKGSVNITLKVVNVVQFTVLHAKSLNITDVEAFHTKECPFPVQYQVLEEQQQIYVDLGALPNPKKLFHLVVYFKKSLSEGLEGFYISSYNTSAGERRLLATTHFEPSSARSAFPCYDEPAFKAIFQLRMSHGVQYMTLFNSPLKERKDYRCHSVSTFQPTLRMSTYLVAFVVSDFKNVSLANASECLLAALNITTTTTTTTPEPQNCGCLQNLTMLPETSTLAIKEEDEGDDTPVNVSVYAPENMIPHAYYALAISSQILDGYKEFFGIAYPLPKLDLVAIPDFGPGAMENWGLVMFRTTTVLFTANDTSSEGQEHVASVIAHELAHQWFGNLVTMMWWNDLWLNEGFASYLEFLGVHFVEPEWDMMSQFVVTVSMEALDLDSLSTSHPIVANVDDTKSIESIFDAISYKKGAALIYMLQNLIGEHNLRLGLKLYLSKFRYSNARTQDLWNAFTQVYGILDIGELMEAWTTEAGYPLVMVVRGVDDRTVWVNQTKFSLCLSCNWCCGVQWTIPLSFSTSHSPNSSTMHIFDKPADLITIPQKAAWIKFNTNQTGYYRVNYDQNLWQDLINQLYGNHRVFSPADRAGLLDDAFYLARSGHIGIHIPLSMSLYLKCERHFAPWTAVSMHLDWLSIMFFGSEVLPDFEDFVVSLVTPALTELGWKDEGSHLTKKLRSLILHLGSKFGHQSTIDTAIAKFKSWKENNISVEPNFRSVVYSAGIHHGFHDDWKFVQQAYMSCQVPSERKLLLKSLGYTCNPWELQLYLKSGLNKNIVRPQDLSMVISTTAENPIGRLMAWHFLQVNWHTIYQQFGEGSFTLDYIISSTTAHFSTQMDVQQVRNFLNSVDLGAGSMAAKHALERIELNARWREQTLPKMENWLQDWQKQTNHPTCS